MALIHLQDAPTVAPSSSPGNDYDTTQAPAAAFGAATARAGEGFGQQTEQAGQNLVGISLLQAQRTNQLAIDSATNKLQDGITKLTYGDQNDPSAPAGLYALHGDDAVARAPQAAHEVATLRDQIAGGLNDAQRIAFDEGSKRLVSYTTAEINSHFQRETDRVGLAVGEATAKNASASAGLQFNSDDAFLHAREDTRGAYIRNAQIQFGHNLNPALTDQAIRQADTAVISSRASSWAEHDPVGALNWLTNGTAPDASGKQVPIQQAIDPATLDSLTTRLRPLVRARSASQDADRIFSGDPLVGATSGDVADAIHGQESGGRSTSATSVNGAQGGWQVTPATFAQYARPGESISSPADNEAVGRRIVGDLSQRFGGDPARIAVGYFSGPGNVAPPGSPTPWLQNKADGNGTTVAAYVSGVLGRMQRSPGSAQPGAVPAQAPAAPQPGTAAYTAHADERFPPPGTSVTPAATGGSAAQPDATNEFPGVPTAPSIAAPVGGGYAPGGPVPVPTPDSPHDTPAVQRAGVPAPGTALPAAAAAGSTAVPAAPTAPATPPRPTLEAMLAQADAIRDPAGVDDASYREVLKSQIRARYGQREASDLEKQKVARDTLLTAAMGGNASPLGNLGSGDPGSAGSAQTNRPTSLDQLLSNPAARSAYLDASPEVQRSVLGILEHNAAGLNPPENNAALTKYYTLRGMSADRPDDFKNTNLADPDLMNALPHNLLLDLMNRQASMSASDAKSQQRGINLLHAQTVTLPDARQAGLNPSSKPGTPAADAWAQYTGRLDDALQRYQQDNNGKRPSDDELKKMGGSLLTQGWLRGTGSLWGLVPNETQTRLFQAESTGRTAQFYPAVPPVDRQQITEGFKAKMGRAPTDAELQQLYMMGRQPMQGPRAVVPPRASPQPGTTGAPSLPMAKQDEGQPSPAAAPAAPGAPPPAPAAANSAGLPVSLIPGGF